MALNTFKCNYRVTPLLFKGSTHTL